MNDVRWEDEQAETASMAVRIRQMFPDAPQDVIDAFVGFNVGESEGLSHVNWSDDEARGCFQEFLDQDRGDWFN